VYDEDNQPGLNAMLILISEGEEIAKKNPDVNGVVEFKDLVAGKYSVKVLMPNYVTHLRTDIDVKLNATVYVIVKMKLEGRLLTGIEILPDYQSMVQTTMSTGKDIGIDFINQSAIGPKNLKEMIVSVTPGATMSKDGKEIQFRGARKGTTKYMIDGDNVIGDLQLPGQSIGGVKVYTGGIPAMYGDVTGGLVVIESKSYLMGIKLKKLMYEEIIREEDVLEDLN
jgi:hypothetical protein